MAFQLEKGVIRWKIHFRSPDGKVFAALATDEGSQDLLGRGSTGGQRLITFHILNYEPFSGHILSVIEPSRFKVEYFGSTVVFLLAMTGTRDGSRLVATGVDEGISNGNGCRLGLCTNGHEGGG